MPAGVTPERVQDGTAPGVSSWRFAVWVQPGASQEAIVGAHGDALKVAVSVPPEKGKANRALRKLLARELGIRASDVRILKGAANRLKTVTVHGVSDRALLRVLRGFPEEKGG